MGNQTTKRTKNKRKYKINSKLNTRYGSKDLDQIQNIINKNITNEIEFYCVECDREFQNENILLVHKKTKQHKRRTKELKNDVQTIKDSELAGGLI